jgi:type II secretory pathway pseudopilin PulG
MRPQARIQTGGRRRGDSSRASRERGFTLLEALIAGVVVTVGLVALAELLGVSLRMHQLGRTSTSATRLAQQKFEELMKLNFDTNPAIQINANDTLSSNVENYFDVPSPEYVRRWQVAAGPNLHPGLRIVTVRVIPTMEDRRASDTVTLTTVLRSW